MRAQKRIKNIVENAKFVNQNNATEMIPRSIAHEIKNPLGGIKGAAQLLKKEIKEEHKEFTNIIIDDVDRLKNYIDNAGLDNEEQIPNLLTFFYLDSSAKKQYIRALNFSKKLGGIQKNFLQSIWMGSCKTNGAALNIL